MNEYKIEIRIVEDQPNKCGWQIIHVDCKVGFQARIAHGENKTPEKAFKDAMAAYERGGYYL